MRRHCRERSDADKRHRPPNSSKLHRCFLPPRLLPSFLSATSAIKPAFNVYRLHERPSVGGIALFSIKRKPSKRDVNRIEIPCLFPCEQIRILDISHLRSLQPFCGRNIAAAPRGRGLFYRGDQKRRPRTTNRCCSSTANLAFGKRSAFRGRLGRNHNADRS